MKFKPFTTSLIGSLPRSKKLMKAKRELKRNEISQSEIDEILEDDMKKALSLQEKFDIEILTSGEIARDNYVSFVSSKLNGVKEMNMSELIEFMPDKQAFEEILQILDVPSLAIKNAICTGKISSKKPLIIDEMNFIKNNSKKPVKATLPGIYLLTRSMWLVGISDKFYKSKEELAFDVLNILKEELDLLKSLNVDVVQFDEPVLTEVVFSKGKTRSFMCAALSSKKDPKFELEFATSLIKEIINYAKKIGLIAALHVCRGNWSKDENILLSGSYAPLINLFENVLADVLFLEFSTKRAGEISEILNSKKIRENSILGLGVINPRSDFIESVDFITNMAKNANKFIDKDRIWLNPDCGFATFANRPVNEFDIIEKKLHSLNLAKKSLRNG